MSISTDGIVCFGFTLDDYDDYSINRMDFIMKSLFEEWDDDHEKIEYHIEFETLIYKETGLPSYDWDSETGKERKERWKKEKEAVARYPVELVQHCSEDYHMWILAVREKNFSSSRGRPLGLSAEDLTVSEEQISKLKEWCVAHGIKYKEPKWLLASYWG